MILSVFACVPLETDNKHWCFCSSKVLFCDYFYQWLAISAHAKVTKTSAELH